MSEGEDFVAQFVKKTVVDGQTRITVPRLRRVKCGRRKTENYLLRERCFCRNCEEQRRQFFEEGNIEGPVGLKRCKQSASFSQEGMDGC